MIGRADTDVWARICHELLRRAIGLVEIRPACDFVVSIISGCYDHHDSLLVQFTEEFLEKLSVIGILLKTYQL